ncbi:MULTISPECIES: glycosyltransferase family 2 protein [unclassified Chryseobacterium]|uniref:glycosyltransferase family 2 protein n=1 Tax=unclassified Chryseobacterium TaxID=2593645 RepID=UPI00100C2A91|nr:MULTISPECIES: glycosyltransferase family 2 protein [unclassified Chryseobacterium]RXM52031.1 capsular biosynthesis protein CpsI [Chryseobacterium sp. CH25]RXM63951.1 capsular biosynthesis protein CpsI [Chryseobacterium sp. CH1]
MRISVVIPVYNAEKYVSQAVDSVLQFDEVHEIILIEDQSPDNALQVCQQLAEKHEKVKLYQHPDKKNHGAGPSRNLGIEKSTGDFIAFLDADDYFLPNRFDAEKELFKDPKVEGVYGALGVHYYSQKAKEQYYQLFGDRLTTVYKKYAPKDVFPGQLHMLGTFGLFSIDTLTVRKESLMNKVQPLFKAHLRLHEDTEFLFRLSYYLDLYPGILEEAIAVRGVHENNRITKVDLRVINPAVSRAILWKEVDLWSQTENSISEDVRIHIKRMHRSFEIAKAPFLKRWGMIIKYFFTDYKSIRSGLYNINFRHSLIS